MTKTTFSYTAAAATAAKSLQSCPTLCNPIDGSPPGSPIPGILQARTLEWVAISFSNSWKWKVKVKSPSRVQLLATPWTAAYQTPPSMGFSRQEYWSGVPLPSPFLILEMFKEWLLHVDNQVNLKKKVGHLHKEILPWGTSLVVQWLRIHFPMQGTQVRSPVRELRSYMPWGSKACEPQRLSPHPSSREPTCHWLHTKLLMQTTEPMCSGARVQLRPGTAKN